MLRIGTQLPRLNSYISNVAIRNFSSTMSNQQQQWNPKLTPEQLAVLRDKYTERPNTGAYLNNKEQGTYNCANCDNPLYSSGAKFDSGCGWPAFYQEISKDSLQYHVDNAFGMKRVEVCCGKCGGHLGHVFEGEGWQKMLNLPTDSRHCINSASLNFEKK
ncbi:hypothetical protein ZYGR_0W00650 [Zygosaccharomyces rouxii]|uniref:Peptide-methionine (R)-S-oxide reductase n=2 Tax=Zygosaccharomyces rouxii TaxID=4956 RepID=C5DZ26_ZYGRC|nr:uncharacterized protein ZYRO0F17688g [Zygosaccharomyces rouxii]KAH9201252.1 SelR domain-containing protein [Zygosaccharomyces rouxii]GAV50539.1 hypothetical protein ZYGR_0W00650 [Zygosaccharomyces rouxii]CAQ43337.1 Uncharacterized protein YCL033C [Zygosaccharomyces rouxii]CAR29037.1 ZYRO0F17688p [Zygosaccharomyces rouxii]